VEVGRSTRFLIDFNGQYHTIRAAQHDEPTIALSLPYNNGEVYLDAAELELGGSWPFHEISDRFQRPSTTISELPDTMNPLSTLSIHYNNGEVYFDAAELELCGSWPFNEDSERL